MIDDIILREHERGGLKADRRVARSYGTQTLALIVFVLGICEAMYQ